MTRLSHDVRLFTCVRYHCKDEVDLYDANCAVVMAKSQCIKRFKLSLIKEKKNILRVYLQKLNAKTYLFYFICLKVEEVKGEVKRWWCFFVTMHDW